MSPAEPTPVKSASRVLDLLELLAANPPGLTFVELIARLGLPKSSLHGLLMTLTDRHWLTQDPHTRQFRIGVRAWQAGLGYTRASSLTEIAECHLRAARDELGETIQLAIVEGTETIYVSKVDGTHQLRLVSEVGSHLPSYATAVGRAIVADQSDAQIAADYADSHFQKFTPHTIGSFAEFTEQLARTRSEGYAIAEGDYTEGVTCLAVAIRDYSGRAVAAMSCSAPTFRMALPSLERERALEVLRRHAAAISRQLGYAGSALTAPDDSPGAQAAQGRTSSQVPAQREPRSAQ